MAKTCPECNISENELQEGQEPVELYMRNKFTKNDDHLWLCGVKCQALYLAKHARTIKAIYGENPVIKEG